MAESNNIAVIGGGSGLGAVIGALAGGGKGALIGAGAGAAAGTAGAAATGKREVGVAAESAGIEPPTSAVLCTRDASARGFAPTPRQFGIDLFRVWRF